VILSEDRSNGSNDVCFLEILSLFQHPSRF